MEDTINTYFPYLMEVRRRLMLAACMLLIGSALGFFYYEKIVAFTLRMLDLQGVNIAFTSPFQFFGLSISCALVVGTLFAFPVLVLQLMSFLKPALKPREYKAVVYMIPISILLFALGFGFGVVMMRFVVQLFQNKSVSLNIGNLLDVTQLLSQIMVTSALMGLAFQFPIVMTFLMKLKVVKYRVFAKQRPFAYIAAMVFAALMPPTDLLSLFLLTFPLVLMFELTLILNKVFLKSHLI